MGHQPVLQCGEQAQQGDQTAPDENGTAENDGGTDELLHVLAGECQLTVRQDGKEVTRGLRAGDLVVVPQGCWHSNDAPHGVTMLFMTPNDGNRHSWDDPSQPGS